MLDWFGAGYLRAVLSVHIQSRRCVPTMLGLHTMIMFSLRFIVRWCDFLGIAGWLYLRHCHAAMGVLPASHVHALHTHALHTHAHILHRSNRSGPTLRNRRRHARSRRERAARIAAAVHGLGKNGIRAILDRFDDDIVGLRHSHAKLIHRDRLDVLSVRLHDCHHEPRNAHIVEGHTSRVDKSQPHPLAWTKQPRPVAGW